MEVKGDKLYYNSRANNKAIRRDNLGIHYAWTNISRVTIEGNRYKFEDDWDTHFTNDALESIAYGQVTRYEKSPDGKVYRSPMRIQHSSMLIGDFPTLCPLVEPVLDNILRTKYTGLIVAERVNSSDVTYEYRWHTINGVIHDGEQVLAEQRDGRFYDDDYIERLALARSDSVDPEIYPFSIAVITPVALEIHRNPQEGTIGTARPFETWRAMVDRTLNENPNGRFSIGAIL